MPKIEKKKGRILVVDDDILTVKTLKTILTSHQFDVHTAVNGEDAQNILEEFGLEYFDCVLTDYRMPKVTGMDLMLWIHERDAALSTIILTGEGEKRLVEEALRGGASDYLEKPFGIQQITRAIEGGIEETRTNRSLQTTASDVKALGDIKEKLNKSKVERIQSFQNHHVEVTTRVYPIKETGGDFFNTWRIGDNRVFLLAGDVSGHDLRAGYVSAYFQGIARGMLETGAGMQQINEFFNRYLIEEWNKSETDDPFIVRTSLSTCFIMLDLQTREIHMHNNGLPQPQISIPNGCEAFGDSAPPLGWYDDLMSELTVKHLDEYGYCYLYTDGLEEMALLREVSIHALAYYLYKEEDDLKRQVVLEDRHDDILLIRLDWSHEDQSSPKPELLLESSYAGDRVMDIDKMQSYWGESLRLALPLLNHDSLYRILLCARESMLNAFQHGTKNRPEVRCAMKILFWEKAKILTVIVSDEGDGYDPGHSCSGETNDEGHTSFGLILIRNHASTLTISPDGRQMEMSFNLDNSSEVN